jgi:hypothetical protein
MTADRTGSTAEPVRYQAVDPYQAISYIISGVGLWGLIGWAAARWLHAPILTGLGLVIGGVLGIACIWLRYGRPTPQQPTEVTPARTSDSRIAQPGVAQPPRTEETP